MKREKVEGSSNIKEVGWSKGTLQIKFKHGGIYDYTPVTEEQYKEMMEAESKGGYFTKNIRDNSSIKYTKVG